MKLIPQPYRAAFAAFMTCLVLAVPMTAQTGANTGLQGAVTDATGAAVPDATVTITRVETGETRTVVTNAVGRWEARLLSPGTHQLTVEREGFKRLIRAGITVTTAEMANIETQLEVGHRLVRASKSLPMRTWLPLNATHVRTLDRRELESLPTSARNFTQLLVVEPGVVGRYQRTALERQRFHLTKRQWRAYDKQQFHIQWNRRDQSLVLQQPHQRQSRNDRRRWRLAVAKRLTRTGNPRGSETANQPLRCRNRTQRWG